MLSSGAAWRRGCLFWLLYASFCLSSNLGTIQTWSKCNRPTSKTHQGKERGKKKKALHRGTFEVVEIFSFQCLAPERESERGSEHVPVFVRGQGDGCGWAVSTHRQGHLLHVGTPLCTVPIAGCGHSSACAQVWLCSRLQPVAGKLLWPLPRVPLCVRGWGCAQS